MESIAHTDCLTDVQLMGFTWTGRDYNLTMVILMPGEFVWMDSVSNGFKLAVWFWAQV